MTLALTPKDAILGVFLRVVFVLFLFLFLFEVLLFEVSLAFVFFVEVVAFALGGGVVGVCTAAFVPLDDVIDFAVLCGYIAACMVGAGQVPDHHERT